MPQKRLVLSASRPRYFRGADVPLSVIRRFARQVAERFDPDKIILFGSHAYGTPHADSDVDILIIMPARNQLDQAFKIHSTLLPNFPLDILVVTPQRWMEDSSFHRDIRLKGKILYEKGDTGRSDYRSLSRSPEVASPGQHGAQVRISDAFFSGWGPERREVPITSTRPQKKC
jgi:predicted nucleotidyltransferase